MAQVKYLKKGDKVENLKTNTKVGICPVCGEPLRIKEGRFGKFIGCSGFKNGCRKTYKITTFRVYDKNTIDLHNIKKASYHCDLQKLDEIRDLCSDEIKDIVMMYWKKGYEADAILTSM